MDWSKTGIVIIALVSIYIIFIFFSDIEVVITSLQQIDLVYLSFAVFLWILIVIFLAIRWHFFMKTITTKVPLHKNILYYLAGFAFTISPGGLGAIIRLPYIKRDYDIPLHKTAPIVLVERFYDLLGITITISVGLLFSKFEQSIVIIPLGLSIAIFLIIRNKSLFLKILQKLSKIKFFKEITSIGEESYDVILNLMKPKNFLLGLSTSIVYSLLAVLGVHYLILGLHGNIDFFDTLVIFLTSNFIATTSMIPGGVGILEGGIIGMLMLYDLEYEIALSVAILVRILNTGLLSLIGLICLGLISKKKG